MLDLEDVVESRGRLSLEAGAASSHTIPFSVPSLQPLNSQTKIGERCYTLDSFPFLSR